nr:PREDICTED: serine/arginine repetitive matrix protein 3-like [Lepisosteus oculatus]
MSRSAAGRHPALTGERAGQRAPRRDLLGAGKLALGLSPGQIWAGLLPHTHSQPLSQPHTSTLCDCLASSPLFSSELAGAHKEAQTTGRLSKRRLRPWAFPPGREGSETGDQRALDTHTRGGAGGTRPRQAGRRAGCPSRGNKLKGRHDAGSRRKLQTHYSQLRLGSATRMTRNAAPNAEGATLLGEIPTQRLQIPRAAPHDDGSPCTRVPAVFLVLHTALCLKSSPKHGLDGAGTGAERSRGPSPPPSERSPSPGSRRPCVSQPPPGPARPHWEPPEWGSAQTSCTSADTHRTAAGEGTWGVSQGSRQNSKAPRNKATQTPVPASTRVHTTHTQ